MADNMVVADANSASQTIRTTEVGGVHTPHQHAHLQVADAPVDSLNPVPVTIVSGGGGTGGGAVTAASGAFVAGALADGASVTEGAKADAAWTGAGQGSIVSILKAIWAKLGSVVLGGGTAVIGRVGVQVTGSDVGNANPLPVQVIGTVTVTGGGSSSLSETLWTDDTGAYFVRVDNGTTIAWKDLSGSATTAPGTGARPAEGSATIADKTAYQATAAATGYSIGDIIEHYVILDPATGAVQGNFWINATTGVKLAAAPASGNIKLAAATGSATGGGATDAATIRTVAATDSPEVLALQALANDTSTVATAADTSKIMNGATALTPKHAIISASTSGASDIVAAVAGKKIRVLAFRLNAAAAVNSKWQSNAATDLTGLLYMPAAGYGEAAAFNPVGHFETVAGEKLSLNLSAAVAVGGYLTYVEV